MKGQFQKTRVQLCRLILARKLQGKYLPKWTPATRVLGTDLPIIFRPIPQLY